jgi:addiction module RelB/DinJ family antitoxin
MPTTILRTRVNRVHAAKAKAVLARLGLTPSGAVNILFAHIASRRALPFAVALPDSDYVQEEYGLTPAEMKAAARRIHADIARSRRRGELMTARSAADLRA